MGFPKQEYLSGLPFPPSGNPRDQGIEPESPTLAGGLFTTEPPGKPIYSVRSLSILLVELSSIFPCNKCIFFFFFACIQELKKDLWLDLKKFSPEICDKGISDKEVSHNSMTTSVSFGRISCAVFSYQLWEFQNDSTVERKQRNTLLSYNLSFWSFRFWKYISDKLNINRPMSLPTWYWW